MENIIKEAIPWVFGGIGIPICAFLIKYSKTKLFPEKPNEENLNSFKQKYRILFIDDNPFRVPDILVNAGWVNTKRIKDVNSLDDIEIQETHIFFVDIQGVGKRLRFADEGLGLSIALKDKYPEKRVVIYSAENTGDRFHKALKRADQSLPKNADPYEFQHIVERFAKLDLGKKAK